MDDRVALITGGAQGLGRAFAEALLEKGVKVCIADINSTRGQQTEVELRRKYGQHNVFFHKCDVTSEKGVEDTLKATVQRFRHLDIVVNNAGISDEGQWKLMLDINLTSVIHTTILAFNYMGKAAGRQNGVIINISSAAGVLPMPFGSVYSALKHGVMGYTRSIGVISPKMFGVRVNCLCPSFTNTQVFADVNDNRNTNTSMGNMADKMISKVGIMQPREVAQSLIRLLENEKLSAGIMLATPNAKELLQMPKTIEEAFATYSKI